MGERKMKKAIPGIISILVLTSVLMTVLNIQQVECPAPPETKWSQTYGGTSDDWAESMIQTSDGGYVLAGLTKSFGAGDFDFWLVKTDANGNKIWDRTYGGTGGDGAISVVETSEGGYAFAGWTDSFGAGSRDFWLVKTDSAGNMIWDRTYGGTHWEQAYSVIQTSDGGYAIAGETQSFGAGNSDAWLIKTDTTGNMQWNKTYGGGIVESAHSVIQTSEGGYAFAGGANSFGAGSWDFWLVKTDANGNKIWDRTYGGSHYDNAYSMIQTSEGGYALAGHTKSFGAGDFDFWLVKTDADGDLQWSQTYGGESEDIALSMVETSDGGYAMAGRTESYGAGGYDFWLVKLAPFKILALVDIDPDTLNLKSNGQWITAYITLPEGYNVEDIVLETVEVEGIPAEWSEIQNGVYMAKFDRATVQSSLTNEPDHESAPKFYDLTLTVTGKVAGTPFEGSDTITVLKK